MSLAEENRARSGWRQLYYKRKKTKFDPRHCFRTHITLEYHSVQKLWNVLRIHPIKTKKTTDEMNQQTSKWDVEFAQ